MRLYTRDELCLLLLFMFLDRSPENNEVIGIVVISLSLSHPLTERKARKPGGRTGRTELRALSPDA